MEDPTYEWFVTSNDGRVMSRLPSLDAAIEYVKEAGYDQYSSPVVQLVVHLASNEAVPAYRILRVDPATLSPQG